MKGKYYSVSYFDAIQGGSGLISVRVEFLHEWLKEHPGYLIRELCPQWIE